MGLLDHLWDDTVAGPRPDSSAPDRHHPPPAISVTRSITIVRPPRLDFGSTPSSPASNPESPLTPATPWGDWRRARRRAAAAAAAVDGALEPRNPTVYDWVVISSLDR